MGKRMLFAAAIGFLAIGLRAAVRPVNAQLRPPANATRLPAGSITLVPRASVTVNEPVYAMTPVPATVQLSNLRNVKSHLILKGETTACWLTPASMTQQEITPAGGRASYSIQLHFVYPESHGQTCALHVEVGTLDDRKIRNVSAGSVHVEDGQTYTIENTWQIMPWVSSITATRINAPNAPCTGMSAGLAGLIPIGPVEFEQDISFNLRSGINQPECTFDSSQPYRTLKKGWAIVDRKWKVERARGDSDACNVATYSSTMPEGTWFYVHSQLRCGGGPDNNNGIRLTLQRLTLLGPPNSSPLDAFISGR